MPSGLQNIFFDAAYGIYLPAPGILHPQPQGLGGDERRSSSCPCSSIFPRNISILQSQRLKYNRVVKAYKYKLKTNAKFVSACSATLDICRELYNSKIGSCRIRLSRQIEGTIKTCTIKREVDGWYVVFAVEENQSRFFPKTGETVGMDVGIENFATLSTGETVENPEFLPESESSLKAAQRKVSRRPNKRSNRRRKVVKLLQKKHQKIRLILTSKAEYERLAESVKLRLWIAYGGT